MLLTAVVFAPIFGADTAHADDGETLVKMSGTSDSDGVYIDVVLLRNVGLTALKLRLEYDETALTYVRALNWNEALKGLAFTASGTDTEVEKSALCTDRAAKTQPRACLCGCTSN